MAADETFEPTPSEPEFTGPTRRPVYTDAPTPVAPTRAWRKPGRGGLVAVAALVALVLLGGGFGIGYAAGSHHGGRHVAVYQQGQDGKRFGQMGSGNGQQGYGYNRNNQGAQPGTGQQGGTTQGGTTPSQGVPTAPVPQASGAAPSA